MKNEKVQEPNHEESPQENTENMRFISTMHKIEKYWLEKKNILIWYLWFKF